MNTNQAGDNPSQQNGNFTVLSGVLGCVGVCLCVGRCVCEGVWVCVYVEFYARPSLEFYPLLGLIFENFMLGLTQKWGQIVNITSPILMKLLSHK